MTIIEYITLLLKLIIPAAALTVNSSKTGTNLKVRWYDNERNTQGQCNGLAASAHSVNRFPNI